MDDPGDAAEVFVGIYMGGDPYLLVHGKESFYITVAAARQCCHEHLSCDNFAGVCVNNGGGVAGPVLLHNLTRFVIQMHGGIGFCQVIRVVLVELGGLIRNLACSSTLIAVFPPEQIRGNTAALEFLMYIGVVRHLVDRLRGSGRE